MHTEQSNSHARITHVHLPRPTAWPMVLALGITLVTAGIITHVAITVLGLVLTLMAAVGWFREVLPEEQHELVDAEIEAAPVAPVASADENLHAEVEPLAGFNFLSGIEGGLAGGVAMAAPAVAYSLVKFHTPWYAINLLAAGGFPSWSIASDNFLAAFHLEGFLAAFAIHLTVSVMVGLLYAALLPIMPRWPIVSAGFAVPLLWTAMAYSIMNIVSPILNERVDWLWFVVSQIAFGLVAGFVVNLRIRIQSPEFQQMTLGERAGLHTNRGPRPHNTPGDEQ